VDTAPESPAPLSSSSLLRHSSFIRAVCVNALVRICAGGDQRWSSLLRPSGGANAGAGCFSGVISHMMVSGQLRVGRPQIHNHWSAFRRSSFLDDKQAIHAMPCYCQPRANSRTARYSAEALHANFAPQANNSGSPVASDSSHIPTCVMK
jgi:hypothetical protein